MIINCKRCGLIFDQKHHSQTYCCKECQREYFNEYVRNKRVKAQVIRKKCKVCACIFETKTKRETCSDKCRHADYRKNRMDVIKKSASRKEWYEKNIDLIRKKSRDRQAELRRSDGYREWLNRTREARNARKEKYRREAGAVPRDVIHAKAVEKRISEAKQKELKKQFKDFFVGPPKPHSFLSEANYYRWRYQNDDGFREKEKLRTKQKKAACPDFYIRQQLGGIECSKELIEAKRLQLQIKRFIKEINHEKY